MATTKKQFTNLADFQNENGKYKPGHDAKHAGIIAKMVFAGEAPTSAFNELPSEKLRAKAQGLVALWQDKADTKAEKERLRAEAKIARDSEKEAAALAKAEAKADAPKKSTRKPADAPRLITDKEQRELATTK